MFSLNDIWIMHDYSIRFVDTYNTINLNYGIWPDSLRSQTLCSMWMKRKKDFSWWYLVLTRGVIVRVMWSVSSETSHRRKVILSSEIHSSYIWIICSFYPSHGIRPMWLVMTHLHAMFLLRDKICSIICISLLQLSPQLRNNEVGSGRISTRIKYEVVVSMIGNIITVLQS